MKPWIQWEEASDARLMLRTPFTVSRRFFGYVTEDPQEFTQLRNQYHNIVLSPRQDIEKMKIIDGTQQLHEVMGGVGIQSSRVAADGNKEWLLRVAKMPCSCLSCTVGE